MKYEFAGNAHRSASWMRDGGGGGETLHQNKKLVRSRQDYLYDTLYVSLQLSSRIRM
jgi:hypothetical protein